MDNHKSLPKIILAVVAVIALIVLFIVFIVRGDSGTPQEEVPEMTEAERIALAEEELGITINKSRDGQPLEYKPFDSDSYAVTQLQYIGESGVTYGFGADTVLVLDEDNTGALAFAPTVPEGMKVGFFFQPSFGEVYCEQQDVNLETTDESVFYLSQWYRERFYRGQYHSDGSFNGPYWLIDYYGGNLDYDESIFDGLSITVHTINLSNKQILDSFKILVERDEEKRFYFSDIVSTDVAADENDIRDLALNTALTYFNDDGAYAEQSINANGETSINMINPYLPMDPAPRYIVERMDNMILTDYMLLRTKDPLVQTQCSIDAGQFPVYAVSTCYTDDNPDNRSVTIYLTRVENRFVYIGYSDYMNPNSIGMKQM